MPPVTQELAANRLGKVMDINNTLEFPPGWTDDDLTEFIHIATHNILASFHTKKKEFEILKDIDSYFQKIIDNLLNPPNFLASMLLLRSHSAYRGACRMCLSGQTAETFVLLRSCIEYSLYALHIYKNPEAGDKWIKRHSNPQSLKAVRKEFTYKNVINTLDSVNLELCSISRKFYERYIDFGAHPNERTISASMKIIKKEGRTEFQQLYLTGDSINLLHGITSTAQAGLCALYILRYVFKERFDIIGITQSMEKYRSILK